MLTGWQSSKRICVAEHFEDEQQMSEDKNNIHYAKFSGNLLAFSCSYSKHQCLPFSLEPGWRADRYISALWRNQLPKVSLRPVVKVRGSGG